MQPDNQAGLVVYEGRLCQRGDRGFEPVNHPLAAQLVEAVRRGDPAEEYRLLTLYHMIVNDLERRRAPQLPQIVYYVQPPQPVQPSGPVRTEHPTVIYEDRGLLSAVGGLATCIGILFFLTLLIVSWLNIAAQLTRQQTIQQPPIIINR